MDVEFLNDDNEESNEENKENNEEIKISDNEDNEKSNKGLKRKKNFTKNTGVSILRKTIAPELRTNKKFKKMQVIPYEIPERDQDMKKEVHETRMKILKKELEIKENQLFAELEINTERVNVIKAEKEIKVLQKQIEEIKLKKLLKD